MAPYVLRLGDVNSVVFLRSIYSQASLTLPTIQHLTSVDAVHQLLTDKCNVAGHVDMLAVLMLSSQIAAMQIAESHLSHITLKMLLLSVII